MSTAISLKISKIIHLKIYLFGEVKLPSELPIPFGSLRKVPTKGSQEAD
jgi:hypothetical protein